MTAFLVPGLQFALIGISLAGILHLLVGYIAVLRFSRRNPRHNDVWPAVTVLKPLYGTEPLLYEALRSFCSQDYPEFQIVFGVRHPHDSALAVVERLKCEMPDVAIDIVIDATLHGSNRKVSNLINMAGVARHGLYVISDSDMHVNPDYLRRVVTEFDDPAVGLVTSLYTGTPVHETPVSDLALSHINHLFYPSALVGMWMCGRSDCFGATMALTTETLESIGGWASLSDQLADDFVLGREVKALGREVRLASVLPATTVPESTFSHMLDHELRWARTIRAMAPVGSVLSLIQYPVSFALLAFAASGWQWLDAELVLASSASRMLAARGIDRCLNLPRLPLWLMPIRDITSFLIVIASYCGRSVQWRGHSMLVGADGSVVLKEIDGE